MYGITFQECNNIQVMNRDKQWSPEKKSPLNPIFMGNQPTPPPSSVTQD